MTQAAWLFALSACFAASTQASDNELHWCHRPQPHPVDVAFEQAMQRAGGVTAGMREAQGEAWQGWDAELNRLYRDAMRPFGKDARAAALRKAQRAWLAWDAAEAASDIAQQADGGSIGPVIVSDLALQRRRARACTLYLMPEDAASD